MRLNGLGGSCGHLDSPPAALILEAGLVGHMHGAGLAHQDRVARSLLYPNAKLFFHQTTFLLPFVHSIQDLDSRNDWTCAIVQTFKWHPLLLNAELLLRRPWFPGNNDIDQLGKIFQVRINSSRATLRAIRAYLRLASPTSYYSPHCAGCVWVCGHFNEPSCIFNLRPTLYEPETYATALNPLHVQDCGLRQSSSSSGNVSLFAQMHASHLSS